VSGEPLDDQTVIDQVRRVGHYRVALEPIGYDKERVKTLGGLWRLVEDTKVSLRGWDYPHVSRRDGERSQGNHHIASWVSWSRHQEYWRFYQSGQFVHLFAFRENEAEFSELLRSHVVPFVTIGPSTSGFLSITSTIWTFTEIFEFISRLGARGLLPDGAGVRIEMRNVKDRVLGFSEWTRDVHGLYAAGEETIGQTFSYSQEDLVSNAKSNAVAVAAWFFERFGANFTKQIVDEIQAEIYGLSH
jgi:hypothetical protein